MRRLALFASISALVLAVLPLAPAQAAGAPSAARSSYIVVLNEGAPGAVAAEHSRRHNTSVDYVYTHALRGYAARMSDRAAENIARDPRVAYVEADGVATASDVQTGATWGLDRLDTRDLVLDGSFEHFSSGSGVHAYVIDTGIRLGHAEFTGRMGDGYDAVTAGGNADDCNGHGTHVAGTVGGTTYGVAKAVTVHPVRVLNCEGSGTWAGVIAGVDWVTANRVAPAVANMSLGGGANSSVDAAVRNSIAAGVTYAVAAGNSGKDACNYSPARVAEALTIGATNRSDTKPSWSNFGKCLDLFAPGVSITSAWHTDDTSTNTISGTSMASPHVAGVAAQYLQLHPTAQPADVNAAIVANATTGKVSSPGSRSPNLLLHSRYGETVTQPVNTGPTAGSDQSVSVTAGSTIEITLTGSDPDAADCDLTFATAGPTSGSLSSISDKECVSGSPNTDSAAVQYTAPSEGSSDSFTYTVNDGEATSAPATVSVTITSSGSDTGSGTPAPVTESIGRTQYGGKFNTNHVDVAVSVHASDGTAVSGAAFDLTITKDGVHWTTQPGVSGTSAVVFSFKNIPSGEYRATVTAMTPPDGYAWSGSTAEAIWTK